MKLIISVVLSALALSGCASTVTTYDAAGKVIGSCKSTGGFIIGGGSACRGTANGEGAVKQ
jgi:hypothetical protein